MCFTLDDTDYFNDYCNWQRFVDILFTHPRNAPGTVALCINLYDPTIWDARLGKVS